jgi:glycosyltransferase involved in cell wall biosynthesis
MTEPLISYVVTVYNKAPYLPATVRSLTQQEGHIPSEYIFVDDVSKDDSVAVVEAETQGIANVTIVKNTSNAGQSVRLNQGARLARGKYILFFDSDDVLAKNAAQRMVTLLEEHKADVVYGEWEKTQTEGLELLSKRVPEDAKCDVSDEPLRFVMNGRFLRMALMARRDVVLKAGGADERILIQDESLPLRLAVHAKRFMKLHAPIMFVPKIEGALSGNISQLNHDRFLAQRNVLLDYPYLDETARVELYRRAVSCGWKQVRHERGLSGVFSWQFLAYVKSRKTCAAIQQDVLQRLSDMFSNLQGVRRQ